MATKKTKKTEADEQLETHLSDEELSSRYTDWLAEEAQLKAAQQPAAQLYDLAACGRWIEQECDEIEPHLDAICEPFKAPQAKQLREELARCRRQARAGRYIANQMSNFRVAREADRKASRDALIKEAASLQAAGHAGLVLLTLAGLMSEQEAKLIRKGRGALDAAQDCQRMGLLYVREWTALSPMIARTRFNDVEPLTLERAKRMQEVGEALEDQLQRSAPSYKDAAGVDWTHQRAALLSQLHKRWEPLRYTALAHAARHDLPELADRLVSMASMRPSSNLYR